MKDSIRDVITSAQQHFHSALDRRPTQAEPAERAYWAATRSTSVSGELCKLCGLVGGAVLAPLAFFYGGVFTPLGGIAAAGGVFGSSCLIAAVGSSASSNKRSANLLALQTWERL